MLAEGDEGHSNEIERLYLLEFEGVDELAVRMIGSLVGALFIWLFTGWNSAWFWIGSYAAVQFAYLMFLRSRRARARASDVRIAQIMFPLVLVSYIWMPIKMTASQDDALSASGFCILACVIIYIVRRSEQYLRMTLIEIGVLSTGLLIGMITILLRNENLVGRVGLLFATSTLVLYLLQGAFIVRRQRLRADAVAERTRHAEKLEAIGKLAGGVAHDFNNMLTAVMGNLELIEEIDDPVLRGELLAEARAAAQHGAQVVRQLLVYARQTDGTPRPVAVADLLQSVEGLCKTSVSSSVTFKVQAADDRLEVHADEALLVAALLNLIKNGVDAVGGAGRITVSGGPRHLRKPLACMSGRTLPPGTFVALAVSDTGPGIPEGLIHRVADPFFTTKPVGKGSGLGLSMVMGLSSRLGGGLEIQSSAKGTTATILLPLMTPLCRGESVQIVSSASPSVISTQR